MKLTVTPILLSLIALTNVFSAAGQCATTEASWGADGAVGTTAFLAGQSFTADATGAVTQIELHVCNAQDAQLEVRLPAAAGEAWNTGTLLATSQLISTGNANSSLCLPSSYGMANYAPQAFVFNNLGLQTGQTYVLHLSSGIAAASATASYPDGTAYGSSGPSSNDAWFRVTVCPDPTAVFGCTTPGACNYSPSALFFDGSCLFNDCAGLCGGPAYDDPICGCVPSAADAGSCQGCTDPAACNYDATKTIDDGSCFSDPCQCDYGAEAATSDCGCVGGTTGIDAAACIDGCLTDVLANDGAPGNATYRLGQTFTATTTGFLTNIALRTCSATDAQVILRRPATAGDAWNSGAAIDTTNLVPASASNIGLCAISSYGITFHPWTNFSFDSAPIEIGEEYVLELKHGLALVSATAAYDGGTSISGTGNPEASRDLNFRLYTCEDNSLVFGCTDDTACNFTGATADDGSCLYIDCNGDCGGNATTTDCGCTGGNTGLISGHCVGCIDPSACNYGGPGTTIDDGSCAQDDCNGDCGGTAVNDPDCGCIGGNTGVLETQCHEGCLTELLDHPATGSITGFMIGQTFTAAHNGYLTQVALRICRSNDATLNVRAAAAPGEAWNSGELLGTSNTIEATSTNPSLCLTSSYSDTNYQWQNFGLDSIPMNPGTTYVLELTEGGALAGTNDYEGGVAVGTSGEIGGKDLAFQIYTCHADLIWGCTVPEKCNYDDTATHNDGSCLNNDCHGDCGGTAVVSDCGCIGGNTGLLAVQCIHGCLTSIEAAAATTADAAAAYPTQTFTPASDGFLTGIEIQGCQSATYGLTLKRDSISGTLLGQATTSNPMASDLPNDACDRNTHGGDYYSSRLLQLDSIPLQAGRVYAFQLSGGLGLANATADHTGGSAFNATGNAITGRDVFFRVLACPAGVGELVWGCTDAAKCNYNPAATHDDGSCADNDCHGDCGGSAYEDTTCGCVGGNTGAEAGWCEGCTDPTKCNYNMMATFDDGSCADFDCNGDCGGTAVADDFCGCTGGATGINPENCLAMCLGDVALSTFGDTTFASNADLISGSGQTFLAPATARLTGVRLATTPTTDSLRMDVLSLTSPNTLTGATVLAQLTSLDFEEAPSGSIFFPLADPVLLTAGAPYAIRLQGTGWLTPRSSADDLYPDGASFSAGASTATNRDLFFEIVTCTDLVGCMDNTACNYQDWATIPDAESCLYLDCNNECGGTAFYSDACEQCIGGATGFNADGCIGGCATVATDNLTDSVPQATGRNGQRLKATIEGYVLRVDLKVCATGNSRLQWRSPDTLSTGWGNTWDEGRVWGLSEIVEGPTPGATDCGEAEEFVWSSYAFDSIPVEPNELVTLVLQGRARAQTTSNNYAFGAIVDNNGVSVGEDMMFKILTCPATITFGCTDPLACNFNEFAEKDDGSCVEPGCSDQAAFNYTASADCFDDSFCHYCDEPMTFEPVDRTHATFGVSCFGSEDGIIEVRPESPRDRVERVELYPMTDEGTRGDRIAVDYLQIHHDPRATFTGLAPGDYRTIAWDAGCPDSLDHEVTEPDSLVWSGMARVAFGVHARDQGNIRFSWTGGAATEDDRPAALIFDNLNRPTPLQLSEENELPLTSGIYMFGFQDGNGCPALRTTPTFEGAPTFGTTGLYYDLRPFRSDYLRN